MGLEEYDGKFDGTLNIVPDKIYGIECSLCCLYAVHHANVQENV
jgi:hypothetical protein